MAHDGGQPAEHDHDAYTGSVPGLGALGPTVERFDAWADAQLERLRGNPVADRVFTAASTLGDFSMIWHLANVARAATSADRRRQLPVLATAIGVESLLVNQGIKRVFKRIRPTETGDERYQVRKPSTSSFPSGHASAAAFNATLLTGLDGTRSAPMWWSLAGIVATSRAYVRIHHASDVVAGLAVGAVLGRVARWALRRF
jgi:membrane-associated phospholipid phosphatase